MTAPRTIYIKNGTRNRRPYYLYEIYSTYEEARKIAKHQKKRNKSRYFIMKHQAGGITGWIIPHEMYALYLDRVIALW